ncbi:protein of unassigned function [Methylobacterium oryzae CBMB20]|uniref:Protein of unassigned function n=1 Tax=Methylobacterium oryzae CBMB20 TaxID=693986 RepID=A0A089P5A1_9HYPH|nr:protein of unassigned function [Methylobacterium oryzae CBMB20]
MQAGTLTLPPIDPEAAAWPSAPTSLCAWRPEAEIPTTGPPAYNGTARGPPAA